MYIDSKLPFRKNPVVIPIGKSIENPTGLSENYLRPAGIPKVKSIGHGARLSTV